MARIGYARVSTLDQDLKIQQERLLAEGCEIVRCEKVSGASRQGRNELATIIEFLREGDELIVTRLDRLGRDTRDVLNIVHECEQRGANITVIEPHVTTKGEMGKVILTVLGMVAQMERKFIKERQREGIHRAKELKAYKGGKCRIPRDEVLKKASQGLRVSEIAIAMNCSRMQIYRIIRQADKKLRQPEQLRISPTLPTTKN